MCMETKSRGVSLETLWAARKEFSGIQADFQAAKNNLRYLLENKIITEDQWFAGRDKYEEIISHYSDNVEVICKAIEYRSSKDDDIIKRFCPELVPAITDQDREEIRKVMNEYYELMPS